MTRLLIALVLATQALGAASASCPDYARLKNAYFGDMHSHTAYSFDAYQFGTRTDPAGAYAFAVGAAVDVATGYNAGAGDVPGPFGYTLDFTGGRLDFAAVTDHAEWLSSDYGCTADPQSAFYGSAFCVALRAGQGSLFAPQPCRGALDGTSTDCLATQTNAWAAERQATEAANDPCTFTTFQAFEWTMVAPFAFDVLHKNVFFKNANVPAVPLDVYQYPTGRALWAALSAQCNGVNDCEAMTIPHNSNQSNGRAFDLGGFTAIDVNRMQKYQRLVEIHQHKGDSECLTDVADSGEITACNFEVVPNEAQASDAPGYVRPALESGLVDFARNGWDARQLGFVGGTDTHDGTPGAVAESGFVGHLGARDNTPTRRLGAESRSFNPGGITGVWAEENTRAAIWAALERRETFATSGPKIRVRFYQYVGDADPCADPTFPASIVSGGGVAMGGTIGTIATAPRFVVYAVPDQTPLAAIDLVKGGLVGGAAVERVTTLPLAGPPYCITWTDPAFDPSAAAFYYARVREQPTWRWSHWDCQALEQSNPADWQTIAPGCASSDPAAGGLDVSVQERAWTSPIWYLPGGPITVRASALALRDGSATGNPGRRRFRFRTNTTGDRLDHRVALPARGSSGDPTVAGATLDVYNSETGERATVQLAATHWSGDAAHYEFREPGGAVQSVVVAPDKLRLRGGGSAFGFTLDEPRQGAVTVRLQLGLAPPWCSEVPARRSAIAGSPLPNDTVDRFLGRPRAPAADHCPALPGTSVQ